MVCDWPTMPKRGAVTSTTRRSRSLRASGDQRVHRRGEAERRGLGRHVVHAAVGDQDRAGDAVGRHVGERRAERREQPRAVGLAVGLAGLDEAHVEARDAAEPLGQRRARVPRSACSAVAEILARALVDHDRDDRGQRLAVLAGERRIGERQHHQRQRERAHQRAAAAHDEQQHREQHARRAHRGPQHVGRNQRSECDAEIHIALLLSQPLEQRRHVHLVGLVVAGQRVHHDVDAGAERELALARLARHHRQHRPGRRRASPRRRRRSFEVMMIEDTPSPARAGRLLSSSSSLAVGSASTQSWPELKRPGKSAAGRTSWSARGRAAPARARECRARTGWCAAPPCPGARLRRRGRAAP